jgi:EmrB/QacA subfamily drug resistance transporter
MAQSKEAAPATSAPAPPPAAGPVELPQVRHWIAFAVIVAGVFMVSLDGVILNVAIPSIQRGLSASFAQIQFMVVSYTAAYAVLLVTGGRVGDIVGRKRLFVIGMAGFAVTSALCGLAVNAPMLIVARILQGVSAAMLFPQVLALIQVTFAGRARDRAFSIYGATFAISQALGLTIGGLLITANLFNLSWRPVFFVNVPIAILAVVLAFPFVGEVRGTMRQRLDFGGVGLITLGLGLLIVPIVQGREAGWPLWAFLCVGLAIVVLAGFFLFERSVAARGGAPLLNPSLFRNRPFTVGLLIALVFMQVPAAFLLMVTFFLQIGLGFSPLLAGLVTAVFSTGTLIASFASVPVKQRVERHVVTVGAIIVIAGMLLFAATIAAAGSRPGPVALLPAIFVSGIGFGFVLSPLINILLSRIPPANAGAAGGAIGTMNQVALSLGVALVGTIFFSVLSASAADTSNRVTPTLHSSLQAAHVNETEQLVAAFQTCVQERARSNDPGVQPVSCAQLQQSSHQAGAPAAQAVDGALKAAQGDSYGHAFTVSLAYVLAALVVTIVLVFLLPPMRAAAPKPA